jgi:hypothetical protein
LEIKIAEIIQKMGKKIKNFLVAPVLRLNTGHVRPLKTAYWAYTRAPGIMLICMLDCILKIFLVNMKILILFWKNIV